MIIITNKIILTLTFTLKRLKKIFDVIFSEDHYFVKWLIPVTWIGK